jgi:RHS repeat-associated protein
MGNRFLYTGREWIAEAGLYDYRNRVYSAQLGRFLQADPIRFAGGDVNIYRYCNNNGVNYIDPYGEALIAGAAIGAGVEIAMQMATGMAHGQTFTESFTNVNIGRVAVSAALGASGLGLGKMIATANKARIARRASRFVRDSAGFIRPDVAAEALTNGLIREAITDGATSAAAMGAATAMKSYLSGKETNNESSLGAHDTETSVKRCK